MGCFVLLGALAVMTMVFITRGGGNVAELSYALEKPLQIDVETKLRQKVRQ